MMLASDFSFCCCFELIVAFWVGVLWVFFIGVFFGGGIKVKVSVRQYYK